MNKSNEAPPHNLHLEQSVIGGLLLEPGRIPDVAELLSPQDFYRRDHQQIFAAILDLSVRGDEIDVLTVSDELERLNQLDAVGGLAYLGSMAKNTPSAANVTSYAQKVRDYSARRKLLAISVKIAETALSGADTRGALNAAVEAARGVYEWFDEASADVKGEIIRLSEAMNELEPPDWLIQGIFERSSDVLLVAPSTAGKSHLALWWLISIATGRDWCGRRVEKGNVVYFCGEAFGGVKRRFRAWEIHLETSLRDAGIWILPRPKNLGINGDASEIAAELKKIGDVSLIVIDTLHKYTAGAEENDNTEMGLVMNSIRGLRYSCGDPAIVFVHHTGHVGERARGASSIGAGVDYTYFLSKCDDGSRTLKNQKNKDGDSDENEFSFKIVGVDIGMQDKWGGKITAGIMTEAQEKEKFDKKTTLLLEILGKIEKWPASKAEVRKEFSRLHDGANKARDFSDALNILTAAGKCEADHATITIAETTI